MAPEGRHIMAVLKRRQFSEEKGICHMARSTVVPFELSSEFLHDPLTEVIQAGARELLGTAVQAEVSGFIAEHAHLLDAEGRRRQVAPRVPAGTRGDDRDRHGAGSGSSGP